MLRFSLSVCAGLVSVVFVGVAGCDDTPSVTGICPGDDLPPTPRDCIAICNADGTWGTQCCGDPPEPPGCGTFVCQGGAWQLDPGGCFSCPDQQPNAGERCVSGARCDYPTTCGAPDQLDCINERWQLVETGCCEPINAPDGCCSLATTRDACQGSARCRWIEPGCTMTTEPRVTGCFPSAPCTEGTCPADAVCTSVGYLPCLGGGMCAECQGTTDVCLPAS